MTAWLPLLRWFTVRALLLIATMLAPGCGYSTYNIPPTELQRLVQLRPSQRGQHMRAYTDGVVPAAMPNPQAATAPSPLPPAPPPPSQPPEGAPGQQVVESVQAEVVDVPEVAPADPPVVVSVDLAPPRFVPAPVPRVRPAPAMAPVHVTAPRALPRAPLSAGHGAAPIVHTGGRHVGGALASHHSGGGGGGAAVGALVGVVVLVGLMVAIAEASQPVLFDGWIRTSPDHPVHVTCKSGEKRRILLRDLKPADIVDVHSAVMYNTEGAIEHLESAASPKKIANNPSDEGLR
jgi:hypothetical protein